MDIIITGATGRLGQNIMTHFKGRYKNVIGVSRTKKDENWITSELENLDLSTFTKPVVIHTAGLLDYNASYKDMFKVNVLGTKKVYDETVKNKGHMIFISSTAVYGKQKLKLPISEGHERKPDNNYGLTKMYAEDAVKCTILRPCPIYGPLFEKDYFEIFKGLNKGKIKILGNGQNHVPFIHVNDVVQAIQTFINKPRNDVYNVTPDQILTQEQLYASAAQELKVNSPKTKIPAWLARLNYLFDKEKNEQINMLTTDRIFDNSKLKKIGWEQKVNINKGIKEMVEGYLKSNN